MPANQHSLPAGYTASDIVGITRGSSRPTVYFSDGSRFTQVHRAQDNIGFHNPPAEQLFFGNVPEGEYQSRLADRTQRALYVQALRDGNPIAFRGPYPGEKLRLVEINVKLTNRTSFHPSRSQLEEVPMAQKYTLITEIRNRSSNKQANSAGEFEFQ